MEIAAKAIRTARHNNSKFDRGQRLGPKMGQSTLEIIITVVLASVRLTAGARAFWEAWCQSAPADRRGGGRGQTYKRNRPLHDRQARTVICDGHKTEVGKRSILISSTQARSVANAGEKSIKDLRRLDRP